MTSLFSQQPARLELAGGVHLFREPDREWLALVRKGTIPPTILARRTLTFLASALSVAEDNEIVLTADYVGMEWEVHVELTKEGLTGKDGGRAVTGSH